MATVAEALESMVPVSAFNKGQASKIFDRVREEGQVIVLKNNAPCAVILSPQEYSRLCTIEYDSGLVDLALARIKASTGKKRLTEADVMEALGITESDLEDSKL